MDKSTLEVEHSTEKNFGIVFTILFILIGGYLNWQSEIITWWPFIIAAILLMLSFIKPTLLKWPNFLWFKFGMLLGAIIAPIVMALVYISTLVPLGIFIRLSGKDLLHIKIDPDSDSYWIKRESPMQPMKNQF